MLLELSSNISVGGAYRLDIVGILEIWSCQGRPVLMIVVSGESFQEGGLARCALDGQTYSQPVVVAVILSGPVVEGS